MYQIEWEAFAILFLMQLISLQMLSRVSFASGALPI